MSQGCLFCGCDRFQRLFVYDEPPAGEVRFAFSDGARYRREIWSCELCHGCVSRHEMDMIGLYGGDYVNATYGEGGIEAAYERILALEPALSDNAGRVKHIREFFSERNRRQEKPLRLLDVGSGLCVFCRRMREEEWECVALDPDPRAVAHARGNVGIEAHCGDFMDAGGLGYFDLVTFNKVLEHVEAPIDMLARSARYLCPGGIVYVEVPDGEAAARDGMEREEFFIDHLFVFSELSLSFLIDRAGFEVIELERLREPSSKFTLRAFAAPKETDDA